MKDRSIQVPYLRLVPNPPGDDNPLEPAIPVPRTENEHLGGLADSVERCAQAVEDCAREIRRYLASGR